MTRRFHISELGSEPTLRLTGGEAHHLRNVLRMEAGETLWLFDGRGGEVLGEIVECSPNGVMLKVLDRKEGGRESVLTIAAAVPKGDRLKWMVEKLTELGVGRYVPLITERSVVDPREGKLERLRQTVIEASKQCGRSRLMEICAPIGWKEFLRGVAKEGELWIAHPGGTFPSSESTERDRAMIVAIGPEGGFTEGEVAQALEGGAKLLGLGEHVLRIETAALAAAALFGVR